MKRQHIIGLILCLIPLPILLYYLNSKNLIDWQLAVTLVLVEVPIGLLFHFLTKEKKDHSNISDPELQAKIKHIQEDLLPAYKRLVGINIKQQNDNLFFIARFAYRRSKPITSIDDLEQLGREIREEERGDPEIPLFMISYVESALEHLKHRKYKDTYKHYEKAKKLVKKFEKNNDKDLLPKINESLIDFRIGLGTIIEQQITRNILEGKCSNCPF